MNYQNEINRRLAEIRKIAKANLPKGHALRIMNKCDRVAVAVKHGPRITPDLFEAAEEKRECARAAILHALIEGQHITLADSAAFQVSQMHTQMCFIRKDIENKGLPYRLESKWVTIGKKSRPVKEYWFEAKEVEE